MLDFKEGTSQKQWENKKDVPSAFQMYSMRDHERRKYTAG